MQIITQQSTNCPHITIPDSSPVTPVLRHINPLHVPRSYYFNIHISNVLPSTPGSSKWAPSYGLPHQNPYTFPFSCPAPGTHRAAPPSFTSSSTGLPIQKATTNNFITHFNPRPFLKRKKSDLWHHQTCARASTSPSGVTDSE